MNESKANMTSGSQSASETSGAKPKISDFKDLILERLESNPHSSVGELIELLRGKDFDCTPQTVRNNLKTWGYEFLSESKQWIKKDNTEEQTPSVKKPVESKPIEKPPESDTKPKIETPKIEKPKEDESDKGSKKNVRGTTLSLNLSDDKRKDPLSQIRTNKPILELETRGRRKKQPAKPLSSKLDPTQNIFKPTKEIDVGSEGKSGKKSTEQDRNKKTGLKQLTESETDNREKALQSALEREVEKSRAEKAKAKNYELDDFSTVSSEFETEEGKQQAGQIGTEAGEQLSEESKNLVEGTDSDQNEGIDTGKSDSDTPDKKLKTTDPAEKSKLERDIAETETDSKNRNRVSQEEESETILPDPALESGKQSAKGKKKDGQQHENRKGGQSQNKQRQSRKSSSKGERERRRSKIKVTSVVEDDGSQIRGHSLAALKRRREKEKRASQEVVREKISREVVIPETITIQELALRMAERSVDVIKLLMKQGQMMQINDVLDADSAQLIAEEMGHTVKRVSDADVEEGLFNIIEDDVEVHPRPPVVTIMGHVDHGKTSLLDVLRKTSVVSGEAGGITQHIGAYQVEQKGRKITFIDTPGHAAFTQMRARGAKVTDIVVLVVAANDGVMPQTKEAISHAKAANVPLLLAINKIDLPSIDLNKVKTELLQEEVVVESMGGEVLEVEVSAKKGINIDKLLDAILLQAELLELKTNSERVAEGVVIEAKLDKGRGNVATILVQKGTLRVGDIVIGGSEWGRVRALVDDHGERVREAEPSKPVEVLGFQGTPEAGDHVVVVENESRAREISEFRKRKKRQMVQARRARGSLEQMMLGLKSEGRKEFVLIVKGDVQGSIEAIKDALEELNTDEVSARIIHSGAGGISEADVTLATASNAVILGFNVRANQQARVAAKMSGIEIRYYSVIYNLVDDVKSAMSGMLTPERKEIFLGNAEILEIFNISKVGKVAGCRITEGVVRRGEHVRLIRDDIVIYEGELGTLKHFKADVREVQAGQECGMNFETYQDMKPGDVIECFSVQEIARTL